MNLAAVGLWGVAAVLLGAGVDLGGLDAAVAAALVASMVLGTAGALRPGPLAARRAGLCAAALSAATLGLLAWLMEEAGRGVALSLPAVLG